MSRTIEVGQRAPEPLVIGGDGLEVPLSTFWRERPVVLAFLRHFG
jgi:hypothetical protein